MSKYDVLCVGEMVIDFLPGAQEGEYLRKAGGAPANVAIAVARNHLRSAMCCAVGNDGFGAFLQRTLTENGVICTKKERIEQAATTMSFVSLDQHGDRSFTFARKPGADMFLTCADVDAAGIDDCLILHAGSCSLSKGSAAEATAYALRRAAEGGKLVSFDMNYRDLLWDNDRARAVSQVREILKYVDFLKVSEEEADMLGGTEQLLEDAAKENISVVVVTSGGSGAKCYWNGLVLNSPAIPCAVVDTTGAGDAFWGNFLSELLREGVAAVRDIDRKALEKALYYGNAAGSLCVRQKGAIEALPFRTEIERLVAAHGTESLG